MTKITDPIWTPNAIRTYTGKVFDLNILDPESICIEDIAHGLSHTARFAGQLEQFYTVSQHSYHVSMQLLDSPKEMQLAALLHDAAEAYLGDMPSPFKKMMPEYRAIEKRLMKVIAKKFDIPYPLHPAIKRADKICLEKEWKMFVEEKRDFIPWTPQEAKANFLHYFFHLKGETNTCKHERKTQHFSDVFGHYRTCADCGVEL